MTAHIRVLIPDSLAEYHDDQIAYILGLHWARHADHAIAQFAELDVEKVRDILTTVEQRTAVEPSHRIVVHTQLPEAVTPAEAAIRRAEIDRVNLEKKNLGKERARPGNSKMFEGERGLRWHNGSWALGSK